MANVRITPQQLSDSGVVPSDNACTSADTFLVANNGRVFIELEDGGSGSTVTFVTGASVGGFSVSDNAVALTASQKKVVGPFAKSLYHPSSSDLSFTVSDNVTARVYQL